MASTLIATITSLRDDMKLKLLTNEEKKLAEKIPLGIIKKLHRRFISIYNQPEAKRIERIKPIEQEFLNNLESIKKTEETIFEIAIQTEPVSFIKSVPKTKEMGIQCNISSGTQTNEVQHLSKSLKSITDDDVVIVKASNYYANIVTNISKKLETNNRKDKRFRLAKIQSVNYDTYYKHIKTEIAIFQDRELYKASLKTQIRGSINILFLSEQNKKLLKITYQYKQNKQSPLLIETFNDNEVRTLVRNTRVRVKLRRIFEANLTYDTDTYTMNLKIGDDYLYKNDIKLADKIKYMVSTNNLDVEYK